MPGKTDKNTPEDVKYAPSVSVIAQFIKDLSFENPHSPALLMKMKEKPHFNVGVDVRAQKVAENTYEVMLALQCKADGPEGKTLFLTELAYVGVFGIQGVPENQLQQLLFIYCPSLIFPFARRIVADVTRDGGMPPLMLDPIDFGTLYNQRLAKVKEEAAGKVAS